MREDIVGAISQSLTIGMPLQVAFEARGDVALPMFQRDGGGVRRVRDGSGASLHDPGERLHRRCHRLGRTGGRAPTCCGERQVPDAHVAVVACGVYLQCGAMVPLS